MARAHRPRDRPAGRLVKMTVMPRDYDAPAPQPSSLAEVRRSDRPDAGRLGPGYPPTTVCGSKNVHSGGDGQTLHRRCALRLGCGKLRLSPSYESFINLLRSRGNCCNLTVAEFAPLRVLTMEAPRGNGCGVSFCGLSKPPGIGVASNRAVDTVMADYRQRSVRVWDRLD